MASLKTSWLVVSPWQEGLVSMMSLISETYLKNIYCLFLSHNVPGISTQFKDHKQNTTFAYNNLFLYTSFHIHRPVYISQTTHYSHLQALSKIPFPSFLRWGSKAQSHSHTILETGRESIYTIKQTKIVLECSIKKINRVHINTRSLSKDNYFDLPIENHTNLERI
jgi:hypothetical protein